MSEKLKVGCFYLSAFSDAPLSPEHLSKILGTISKQVLRDGKCISSGDLMEAKVRFRYRLDENV